ncbi:MAG: DUF4157 domain-containing protein [Solirubrobacteraceae bacterium]
MDAEIIRDAGVDPAALTTLLARSRGIRGEAFLSGDARRWLSGLQPDVPATFTIHTDAVARRAATLLGVAAFSHGNRIFLGEGAFQLEHVLRHEIVHLAQVQLALRTGCVASSALVEAEAVSISGLPVATPVRLGADPEAPHTFLWFIAIGVGLYVLLRPGVANAPGPADKPMPSPATGQIVVEAMCIFVVPGGAMSLGGRLGLGFLGSAALAGASANVGLRAVGDVATGSMSPPLMYLFDAATGAVIGFVVPGGVRLIGRAGTRAFDYLATYGLRNSDIALTRILAEQAARAPLTAGRALEVLKARSLVGQVSTWWLDRRGVILLYRGQELVTDKILSPLARQEGVAASQALVAQLRQLGMSYPEIAGYSARWHAEPVPPTLAPPGMAWKPLGAAGIPASQIPGIAANFGGDAVIYVIRVPKNLAVQPLGWQGLKLEGERVIFHQVPSGAVVQAIPASRVAPLMVDQEGLLVPGNR